MTVEIPDDYAAKLSALAEMHGVTPDQMLGRLIEDAARSEDRQPKN